MDDKCKDKETQKSQFASGEGLRQAQQVEAEGEDTGSEGCVHENAAKKHPKVLEAATNESCNSAEGADPNACKQKDADQQHEKLTKGYSPAEGRLNPNKKSC